MTFYLGLYNDPRTTDVVPQLASVTETRFISDVTDMRGMDVDEPLKSNTMPRLTM